MMSPEGMTATETNWDERVSVFWGCIGPCGHLGAAARDRAGVDAYALFSPIVWTIEHPTRRQLKEAHDGLECDQCAMPDLIQDPAKSVSRGT